MTILINGLFYIGYALLIIAMFLSGSGNSRRRMRVNNQTEQQTDVSRVSRKAKWKKTGLAYLAGIVCLAVGTVLHRMQGS